MREQVKTNCRNDFLTGLLQNNRLNIRAYERDYENAGIYRNIRKQHGHLKVVLYDLFNLTDEQGGDNIICYRKQHYEKDDNKAADIGLCVFQKIF